MTIVRRDVPVTHYKAQHFYRCEGPGCPNETAAYADVTWSGKADKPGEVVTWFFVERATPDEDAPRYHHLCSPSCLIAWGQTLLPVPTPAES